MSYRSTEIRRTDDGWAIDGDLTPHGVTRQVPLAVEVNGFRPDPIGGQRVGFTATAQTNRRDFGIDTTIPMDGGGRGRRQRFFDQPRDPGHPPDVTRPRCAAAHRQHSPRC